MQIGIFGGPRSGKSTLLRLLVAQFGHKFDELKGKRGMFVVNVPDDRVDYLDGIFKPKKKVYRTVTLVEVPPGNEGLIDSQNVQLLNDCDLFLLLIPLFQYGMERTEAAKEGAHERFRALEIDFCLADYLVIQKRLERLQKEGRKTRELSLMKEISKNLESGKPLREIPLRPEEKKILSGFSLLSGVPIIVVLNVSEDDLKSDSVKGQIEEVKGQGIEGVVVCANLEEEVMNLDPEDREIFLKEAGIDQFAAKTLFATANRLLDLITFLTVNPNEVRAWGLPMGSSARDAAGKIHSDMERGFIRAEVVSFGEFAQFNDMAKAKGAGKIRVEGKDYIVQEGDIVTVRFNV